jgi:hypothetical protein
MRALPKREALAGRLSESELDGESPPPGYEARPDANAVEALAGPRPWRYERGGHATESPNLPSP